MAAASITSCLSPDDRRRRIVIEECRMVDTSDGTFTRIVFVGAAVALAVPPPPPAAATVVAVTAAVGNCPTKRDVPGVVDIVVVPLLLLVDNRE
jgi:hypothetical protein